MVYRYVSKRILATLRTFVVFAYHLATSVEELISSSLSSCNNKRWWSVEIKGEKKRKKKNREKGERYLLFPSSPRDLSPASDPSLAGFLLRSRRRRGEKGEGNSPHGNEATPLIGETMTFAFPSVLPFLSNGEW
ncbi:hypothetical protein BHE74_00033603 [Ensete ventricosum]|nr:hypothetical protein BHE74_00033603 [Ensete ventricosum]RZR91646.1 hypothetical protein BHM03_00019812 [Ensete ventricosum]